MNTKKSQEVTGELVARGKIDRVTIWRNLIKLGKVSGETSYLKWLAGYMAKRKEMVSEMVKAIRDIEALSLAGEDIERAIERAVEAADRYESMP